MIHHKPEKHNVRRGCLQCWSIEKQKCNFHLNRILCGLQHELKDTWRRHEVVEWLAAIYRYLPYHTKNCFYGFCWNMVDKINKNTKWFLLENTISRTAFIWKLLVMKMKFQTNWKLKMFFVCSVFLCIKNTYLKHFSDLKSFWYQFNWNLTWLVLFPCDSRAFILFSYCYCLRFITSPGEYSKILIWRKTYMHLLKEEDE